MAKYLCPLKERTLAEWTATGSIIGKNTEEPTAPSEATLIKINTTGKKDEGNFTVPTLAAGEKVIAASIHVYAKESAEGKGLKFGFVSQAVFSEPTVLVASGWFSVSLSKAQAEALTQAGLEAQHSLVEQILSKTTSVYEIYLLIETELATTGNVAPSIPPTFFSPQGLYKPFVQGETPAEAFSQAISQSLGLSVVIAGGKIARGAAAQTTAYSQTNPGGKVARGTSTETVAFSQVTPGGKIGKGASTQTTAFSQVTPGGKIGTGATTETVGFRQTGPGSKRGVGSSVQSEGFTQTTSGKKSTLAAIAQFLGLAQATTGKKSAGAPGAQTVGIRQFISSAESFAGAIAQSLGLSIKITGSKTATGSSNQASATRQSTQGKKVAAASSAQTVAVATSPKGFKSVLGKALQRLGIRQLIKAAAEKVSGGTVSIASRPQATIAIVNRPQASIGITSRPQAGIGIHMADKDYHVGDIWEMVCSVTDNTGKLAKPGSLVLTVEEPGPNGETKEVSVVEVSEGIFEGSVELTKDGPWHANATTTAPHKASQPASILVRTKFGT